MASEELWILWRRWRLERERRMVRWNPGLFLQNGEVGDMTFGAQSNCHNKSFQVLSSQEFSRYAMLPSRTLENREMVLLTN